MPVHSNELDTLLANAFQTHASLLQATQNDSLPALKEVVVICQRALRRGGKILFFGNGGSAADAQHLATELTVRYLKNRPAIGAIALTTDTSTLTAAANDLGFAQIFARQVEALGRAGDVAIAISTSGTSENVIRGVEQARQMGLHTVGFTGFGGGDVAKIADICICVPSTDTPRIQEMHILLGHSLCDALESGLGE